MLAVKEIDDVLVDYNAYPEPVVSIEQVYRMLQESEESVAQGRIFTKEEALKKIEMASNL